MIFNFGQYEKHDPKKYNCDFLKLCQAALCITNSINVIYGVIFASNMKINGTYRSNGIIMEAAQLI